MKRMSIIVVLVVGWLLFCAGCMRFRMNDNKAQKLFKQHDVQLRIGDTVINGTRLHFAITGGYHLPTLVFVHGSPGSWSNYAAYLYDTDLLTKFRMISIDRPGFGYSDFGQAKHLQEQAILLDKLLEGQRNGKPVFLLGHSIGGPVVAQMAAFKPENYQTLVILSGSISPYLEKREAWRSLLDNTILRKFLPGAFAPSNTEIAWFKKDLFALEKDLALVESQVLFVHGEQDKWVPLGNVAFGMQKMTNAASKRSVVLQEGHFLPWKKFEEIKELLLNLY